MKISNKLIKRVLEIDVKEDFCFNCLGLVNSDIPNTLSFIDDIKYINELNSNTKISGVLTTKSLSNKINSNLFTIVCDNPRIKFYSLMNYIDKKNYKTNPNIISNTAIIDKAANIGDYNIKIGENVIIGPNVTIYPDVIIGDNCKIRAGSVIGVESAEYKKNGKEYLHVFHAGKVIIENNVEIGSNCVVDKGFSYRDTFIREHTKINNLVYIAHAAHIGKRCVLIGNSMICGAVTIGNDVWVGASATISNGITIGSNVYICIGSVVTNNIESGKKISGNFAIEHDKFIKHIKNINS